MHGEVQSAGHALGMLEAAGEKKILQKRFHPLIGGFKAKLKTEEIAKKMTGGNEEVGDLNAPNSSNLPCAYTYFGQLVAHDLTSHRMLGANVPPSLRLNTLYGFGASSSPHIYQHREDPDSGYTFRGIKFFLDTYTLPEKGNPVVHDVPRRNLDHSPNAPLRESAPPNMADARNDQNFILSQLCVAVMRRHNQQVEQTYNKGEEGVVNFKKARRALFHEYQRVILTDYLPRILWGDGQDLLKALLENRKNFVFFDPNSGPCRLSEVFARAGMRWHTQVRPIYQVREKQGPVHLFLAKNDLRGFVRDRRRKIDWQCLLYEEPTSNSKSARRIFQPAKAFDHRIVLSLGDLRFLSKTKADLVQTNLNNSIENFGSGQAFFKTYVSKLTTGNPTPHEKALLDSFSEVLQAIEIKGFEELGIRPGNPIPLWLFLMLEADVMSAWKVENGKMLKQGVSRHDGLGPLGSRIVAEQIVWVLLDDPESVLWLLNENADELPKFNPVVPRLTLADWMANVDPDAKKRPSDLDPVRTNSLSGDVSSRDASLLRESKSVYTGNESGYRWSSLAVAEGEMGTEKLTFLDASTPEQSGLRNTILLNGFYFYGTTQNDPGDRKDRIRTYVSRTRIYHHSNVVPDARWLNPEQPIRGLFFNMVMNQAKSKLFFTVRGVGTDGSVPEDYHLWLETDTGWLYNNQTGQRINANGDVSDTGQNGNQLNSERLELEENFASNHFVHLKNQGFEGAGIEVDCRQLLRLLQYDEKLIKAIVHPPMLKLHLVSVTGQQIADSEGIEADPNNAADAAYLSKSFLGLAIETIPHTGNGQVSAAGRPYPPHCYSNNLADWK